MSEFHREHILGARRTLHITRAIEIPEGYELVSDRTIQKDTTWQWLEADESWAPVIVDGDQGDTITYIRPIPLLIRETLWMIIDMVNVTPLTRYGVFRDQASAIILSCKLNNSEHGGRVYDVISIEAQDFETQHGAK